jgi:DNA-binding response OmpR family regulator
MSEYKPLVLMIEDNLDILRLNGKWLAEADFETVSAETLNEARNILENQSPDIVILDIILPDGNGLEFLPELKSLCDAPVLFCSSRNEDAHVLQGFAVGGNDYITKPHNVDILVARVKAMWQKEQENREKLRAALAAKTTERVIERGPLKLDTHANRAYLNGVDVRLTPKQFALLFTLVQKEGQVISTKELYESAWNLPAFDDTRTIKDHISRLRKNMSITDFTPLTITSERGNGYCFEYHETRR